MISGYLARRTWLHAAPAGVKLLLLFVLGVASMTADHWTWIAALLAAASAIHLSLGREACRRLASLRPLLPLLLVVGILQGATETWQSGMTAVARMIAMILFADLVAMTTTMQALMEAVAPIFRPLRLIGVDAKRLTLLVALVVRFVPVLFANWKEREEAWRARTGRRTSVRLIGPFMVAALRMADQVAESIDARSIPTSLFK